MGLNLLPIDQWREDEVFVGKWPLRLPGDLPEGTYELGFLVFDATGTVQAPIEVGSEGIVADGDTVAPRLAVGEVRFPDILTVVPGEAVEPLAQELLAQAIAIAGTGACEDAEARWIRAKRQVPYLFAWHDAKEPVFGEVAAVCWAAAAEDEPDRAPELLARAHRWDHDSAALARVGAPVGERLWQEGLAARELDDHEAAYRAFTRLLAFQPWRSWARRYAEEARDVRLGITGDEPPFPEPRPEAGAGGG